MAASVQPCRAVRQAATDCAHYLDYLAGNATFKPFLVESLFECFRVEMIQASRFRKRGGGTLCNQHVVFVVVIVVGTCFGSFSIVKGAWLDEEADFEFEN